MRILVTGAKGFIGKNLCLALRSFQLQANHPLAQKEIEVLECDLDTSRAQLNEWLDCCDIVLHLAGVNRPKDPAEYRSGNAVFTEDILARLASRAVPILLASSTQAALDNEYGRSKKAAEEAVFAYGKRTGAPVYVYRFANVFGKWCRPNYNSAVATWCYNIAHDQPIMVRDPNATVTLIYIDDLVNCITAHLLETSPSGSLEPLYVEPSYTRTLGEITNLIQRFHDEPQTLQVPNQFDAFTKKLYSTYLSYLPEDQFAYPVVMHTDARGSFTELLQTEERGQVSVNISKPGITKGQHWHHTKHEKFCVVSGQGLIQFRRVDQPNQPVIEYRVSGEKIEVVRIPPGYTHNIINLGEGDLVTVMWANERFDPEHPDTFFQKVED